MKRIDFGKLRRMVAGLLAAMMLLSSVSCASEQKFRERSREGAITLPAVTPGPVVPPEPAGPVKLPLIDEKHLHTDLPKEFENAISIPLSGCEAGTTHITDEKLLDKTYTLVTCPPTHKPSAHGAVKLQTGTDQNGEPIYSYYISNEFYSSMKEQNGGEMVSVSDSYIRWEFEVPKDGIYDLGALLCCTPDSRYASFLIDDKEYRVGYDMTGMLYEAASASQQEDSMLSFYTVLDFSISLSAGKHTLTYRIPLEDNDYKCLSWVFTELYLLENLTVQNNGGYSTDKFDPTGTTNPGYTSGIGQSIQIIGSQDPWISSLKLYTLYNTFPESAKWDRGIIVNAGNHRSGDSVLEGSYANITHYYLKENEGQTEIPMEKREMLIDFEVVDAGYYDLILHLRQKEFGLERGAVIQIDDGTKQAIGYALTEDEYYTLSNGTASVYADINYGIYLSPGKHTIRVTWNEDIAKTMYFREFCLLRQREVTVDKKDTIHVDPPIPGEDYTLYSHRPYKENWGTEITINTTNSISSGSASSSNFGGYPYIFFEAYDPNTPRDQLEFSFSVPEAGQYDLLLHLSQQDTKLRGMVFRIDDGPYYTVQYLLDPMELASISNEAKNVYLDAGISISLEAGSHTLTVMSDKTVSNSLNLIGVSLFRQRYASVVPTTTSPGDWLYKGTPDTSWYDGDRSEYILTSAAQFMGFLELRSTGKTFENMTIKLATDVVINSASIAKMLNGDEKNFHFAPVPNQSNLFLGTFDGDGHTVSGVFMHADSSHSSIFGPLGDNAAILNLTLENSAIVSTSSGMVSCLALLSSKVEGKNVRIENVELYDCAIYDTVGSVTHAASMVAAVMPDADLIMRSCQMNNTYLVLDHPESGYASGLVDEIGKDAILVLDHVLCNATLIAPDYAAGMIYQNLGVVILSNSSTNFGGRIYCDGAHTGTGILKGNPAQSLVDVTPVMTSFYTGTPDTSWYDGSKTEYTLTSADQFIGFLELRKSMSFTGITVKLAVDVVINQELTADEMLLTPPTYGLSVDRTLYSFGGIFDGQGHTVSGLYQDFKNSICGVFGILEGGAVIKNLTINRTCFVAESTSSPTGPYSFIAASVSGENVLLENIHVTNSILHGKDQLLYSVGGLIGQVISHSTVTISSCSVDSNTHLSAEAPGSKGLGGLVGFVEAGGNVIIHNSTANAVLKGDMNVDELVGRALGSVTVTDDPIEKNISYYSGTPDASWYDNAVTDYVLEIHTADQFMAFLNLREQGVTFANRTVKLCTNVVINKKTAAEMYAGTHKYDFNNSTANSLFQGTFDGQGYTVSGLYFETNYGTDHTSSSIYGNNRSGIFGGLGEGGKIMNLTLDNICFASLSNGSAFGFLVGNARGNGMTIKNVHITNSIMHLSGAALNAGGLVGIVDYNSNLTIQDCTIDENTRITATDNGSRGLGGFVGQVQEDATLLLEKNVCGAILEGLSQVNQFVGIENGTVKVDACVFSGTLISGDDAEKSPYYTGTPDTSWYDSNDKKSEYTLTTADQFVGLLLLLSDAKEALDRSFETAGVTFYLDVDVVINLESVASMQLNAPTYLLPRVHGGTGLTDCTFDGQGHSITGLYYGECYSYFSLFGTLNNATVKNLTVKDSYFRQNPSSAIEHMGIISYGAYGGSSLIENVQIQNCLIEGNAGNSNNLSYMGALVGSVNNSATLTLRNCTVSDTSISLSNGGTHIGGMVGSVQRSSTLNILSSTCSADVAGVTNIGGFVGNNEGTVVIGTASRFTGTVGCITGGKKGDYVGNGDWVELGETDHPFITLTVSDFSANMPSAFLYGVYIPVDGCMTDAVSVMPNGTRADYLILTDPLSPPTGASAHGAYRLVPNDINLSVYAYGINKSTINDQYGSPIAGGDRYLRWEVTVPEDGVYDLGLKLWLEDATDRSGYITVDGVGYRVSCLLGDISSTQLDSIRGNLQQSHVILDLNVPLTAGTHTITYTLSGSEAGLQFYDLYLLTDSETLIDPPIPPVSDPAVYSGTPDTSWFDPDDVQSEYTLTTADQFVGLLLMLSGSEAQAEYGFVSTGITFFLDTDVIINTATLDAMEAGAPAHLLPSVLGTGRFGGNFQGQGHKISGLYYGSFHSNHSLFGTLDTGAVIQDLTVENSFFRSNGEIDVAIFGIIASCIGGTDVYLEGIHIRNCRILDGGRNIGTLGLLVGTVPKGSSVTLQSCLVEDCTVMTTGSASTTIGGLVGQVTGGTLYLADTSCLSNLTAADICGGLLGVNYGGTVYIHSSCSFDGEITCPGTNKGSLVGLGSYLPYPGEEPPVDEPILPADPVSYKGTP